MYARQDAHIKREIPAVPFTIIYQPSIDYSSAIHHHHHIETTHHQPAATMKSIATIILALFLAPTALAQVACCLAPGVGVPAGVNCGLPEDEPACVRLPYLNNAL